RRRHTSFSRDWSSDVCSSDLVIPFNSADLLETDDARRALSSGATLPFVKIMLDTVKIMAGERGERMHEALARASESAEILVVCEIRRASWRVRGEVPAGSGPT